jgi:ABC-2 type transport system ATP-binding protein
VRFTAPAGADLEFVRLVAGVQDVVADHEGQVSIVGEGPLLARVAHALVDKGMEPEDLRVELPTLEDAYLTLTGTTAPADERTR